MVEEFSLAPTTWASGGAQPEMEALGSVGNHWSRLRAPGRPVPAGRPAPTQNGPLDHRFARALQVGRSGLREASNTTTSSGATSVNVKQHFSATARVARSSSAVSNRHGDLLHGHFQPGDQHEREATLSVPFRGASRPQSGGSLNFAQRRNSGARVSVKARSRRANQLERDPVHDPLVRGASSQRWTCGRKVVGVTSRSGPRARLSSPGDQG